MARPKKCDKISDGKAACKQKYVKHKERRDDGYLWLIMTAIWLQFFKQFASLQNLIFSFFCDSLFWEQSAEDLKGCDKLKNDENKLTYALIKP